MESEKNDGPGGRAVSESAEWRLRIFMRFIGVLLILFVPIQLFVPGYQWYDNVSRDVVRINYSLMLCTIFFGQGVALVLGSYRDLQHSRYLILSVIVGNLVHTLEMIAFVIYEPEWDDGAYESNIWHVMPFGDVP